MHICLCLRKVLVADPVKSKASGTLEPQRVVGDLEGAGNQTPVFLKEEQPMLLTHKQIPRPWFVTLT